MGSVVALASLALIFLVLRDGFEAMVLPRRVAHRFRFTPVFYRSTWPLWRALACWLGPGKRREGLLGLFGPLSLFALIALWVVVLIVSFALLHWSLATAIRGGRPTFGTYLYLSGVTFFTLGYGDVTPAGPVGRVLAVVEAGMGFAFLAVVIGYMPVLYQAFSRREVSISLLDARAGSPPSAAQVLLRLARSGSHAAADPFLAEWERWSAELLESHISFPVLSYYRSQHDNQSWLAALTAILDSCTLLLAGASGCNVYQAQLTFAMARHAAVDLALVLRVRPRAPDPDRLPEAMLRRLGARLRDAGLDMKEGAAADAKVAELRGMYEPFVNALAGYLMFTLPPVLAERDEADNWQRSAWMPRAPGIEDLPAAKVGEEHFN